MKAFSKLPNGTKDLSPRTDYTAVDLFSGCGGLSVGLKAAGLTVVAGVELDEDAAAAYRANHPSAHVYQRDIRTLTGSELASHAPGRKIDVLAGCPPCQGFSPLTAKWHRSDPRDELVREMARIIDEVRPSAVMMENVPGLSERKGKEIFSDFVRTLERLGYVAEFGVLQAADFGVPQRRRRLVLLAGDGFRIPLPKPTHGADSQEGLLRWRTVRDAIGDMPSPVTFLRAKALGGPQAANWHVVRNISELNKSRLRYAKPGRSWRSIPKRLRPDCHKGSVGDVGFRNVYGRMSWNEPSGTITGGCTTPSKGRFGHPRQLRTISVREAARLQTFPDSFIFPSPFIDRVCEMIGNAFPCKLAEVMASACVSALQRNGQG